MKLTKEERIGVAFVQANADKITRLTDLLESGTHKELRGWLAAILLQLAGADEAQAREVLYRFLNMRDAVANKEKIEGR